MTDIGTPPTGTADGVSSRWFVTGASSGLGRALTERALARGKQVVATVRRADALADLQHTYAEALEVEILDVTDSAQADHVIARTLSRGPVHVVVNNAGYGVTGAAEEMTDEQVQDQLDTLLVAPIRITRRFLGPMRRQGAGHIIQVSSVGGQVAFPTGSAYHAGKWGLEGFTESLAAEVAHFGIRFTLAELGSTRTGFGSAIHYTDQLDAYRDGPVARMRDFIRRADESVFTGDPDKIATILLDVAESDDPPLRLPLGADSYATVTAALRARLDAVLPLQDVAVSADF